MACRAVRPRCKSAVPWSHCVTGRSRPGRASRREDLVMTPDYVAPGVRLRASESATE